MDTNYNIPYSFPRQKLARSKKDEDWGKENIDYIIRLTQAGRGASTNGNRNSFERMRINYDLYNNIINKEDFNYVTNPYGVNEEFPARMENYNIITPKLKLLEGEEIKRPFNFRVVAVNSDAVSQIEEKKKEMLLQYLESQFEQELQAQGINIQNPTGQVQTPPEIEKYMGYSQADMREETANNLAKYLIKHQNLEYKFNKGFKDGLISASEIYFVGIESNTPVCENVNPLDFDFDKNPDLDFIQDSQWASHTKYCTPSEIIDTYYDDLSENDVDMLDRGGMGGSMGASILPEGPATGPLIPVTYSNPNLGNTMRNGFIRVTRVEWKSLRKIGFLTYYDDELTSQEKIVDETYKAVKENGETVEWAWINEVWEGTKIGKDIYVRIKPKTVQYRSIDNPSLCKLGYIGTIYNDRNSIPTSIVDLVKHHQYLYNIIMYRLELEIAKAKGKKMVMDIAQIPRSQDIDLEKWMYYFDTLGIAFINSFEEGKGKFAGQVSAFNQFTSIDMSLSQSVQQYINILIKLEDMVSDLMGVTKQRQGSITSSETVGGVERSVTQSSHITEPLFYVHNEVKKHVLTQLIESAKIAYPAGKKINFLLDDTQRMFLTVNNEFLNADYGIFVTNSAKEIQALSDLKQLANQAISSGMITLKEAVTIIQSESISEVKNIIITAEKDKQAEVQQQQQHEQELQQQQAQAAAALQKEKDDRLDQREYIKGEIDKQKAAIEALGYAKDTDVNNNGVPDVFESEKLAADMIKHRDNMNQEDKKLDLEKLKLSVQQKIADKKLEVDKIKARKPSGK